MEENEYGIILRKIRKEELHKTQQEMADSIGISQSQWASYERGAKSPGIGVLKRIALTHGISMDRLCGLDDKNEKAPKTLADILKQLINIKECYEGIDYKVIPLIKKDPTDMLNMDLDDTSPISFLRGIALQFDVSEDANSVINRLIDVLFGYGVLNKQILDLPDDWQNQLTERVSDVYLIPKTQHSSSDQNSEKNYQTNENAPKEDN